MKITIEKKLFIGFNDKIEEKQLIKTSDIIKIIKQVLYKYNINYFTISQGAGVYVMDASGRAVEEKSAIITICQDIKTSFKNRKVYKNIIEDLKVLLNQESIGFTKNRILSNF